MSFHAYLRKITSGNFISLDELSCKIKPGEEEITNVCVIRSTKIISIFI